MIANDNAPRNYCHDGIVLDEDPGIPLAELRAAWARLNTPSADILACAVAMRPNAGERL